ncbi:hypothetical protein EH165_05870 [Nakamurella antarctica]|uniref:Uncharacterized protein n=1 Tax=Nakamurella antarctica TaxID=1902245 RepID=A0A3G8ZLP2_9ACTN|nr:hypothetical protein [Nakamurella antarctica]AZI57745.1 hypothetical protein EH165_05870 [Nakamurella antarctica]
MLNIRRFLAIAAISMPWLPTVAIADEAPLPLTGSGCTYGGCGVNAYDPGSNAGPAGSVDGKPAVARDVTAGAVIIDPAPQCVETALNPQPSATNPWWSGHTPGDGQLMMWNCNGVLMSSITPYFRPNADPAAPAAPPPVDPAVLAQQAYQALKIPNPQINFGPNANQVAVNYWVYLWAGDTAPLTASATAGTVTVTATATLSKVVWTMGEPVSATHFTEPAPPITCAGGGINPGPDVDIAAKNPIPGACAYKYRTKSTPERTNDARTWPVTAAASWTITWTANTGESGEIDAPTRVSNTNLYVGEWRTVLIPNTPAIPGQ